MRVTNKTEDELHAFGWQQLPPKMSDIVLIPPGEVREVNGPTINGSLIRLEGEITCQTTPDDDKGGFQVVEGEPLVLGDDCGVTVYYPGEIVPLDQAANDET